MEWLRGEVTALEGHMTLGRDFAATAAFKAMFTGLLDAGCDHMEHLSVQNVDHYW